MTSVPPVGIEDEIIDEEPAPGASLASRVEQRASELRSRTYEWFEIPGYEGVLEVALRPLPMRTVIKVQERARKVRDEGTAGLYSLADNLIAATHAIREVRPDGTPGPEIPGDWVTVAQWTPGCPDQLTRRVALLQVVGESRIMFLGQQWAEWQRRGSTEVSEEVVEDFSKTG